MRFRYTGLVAIQVDLMDGTIKSITEGEYTVVEKVAEIETSKGIREISMLQKWPVRRGRPVQRKLNP